MKYSSVLVEELKPTRSFRFFPRCIVLTFIAGIVFYCVYSVIQVPVNEITSGRLQSGSVHTFGIRIIYVPFENSELYVNSFAPDESLNRVCALFKAGHSPSICSNPFGGLLSRPFPFSGYKIWWVIHRSDCADRTYGQLDPLDYCASSSLAFKTGPSRPDFPVLTPIHTHTHFVVLTLVREAGSP
ncbi:hypothetical protein AVEN_205386-1 [Araneus ventricosus]|uniref:Uncharacterized protein n=1 Tax=Araneus ventricosus TaxID=182803 RepID=A0A4Y2HVT0_ARAVE|nr:hypothetical protein AVEN_205386-1 [Araneus ventricosus]